MSVFNTSIRKNLYFSLGGFLAICLGYLSYRAPALSLTLISGFFFIILAAFCLWAAITKSRVLPYIVLGSVVLGQLVRVQLSNDSSGSVLFVDILTGLYVVIGLIHVLMTRKKFPLTLSVIMLLVFWGWLGISLIANAASLSPQDILEALFYLIRFILMTGAILITSAIFTQEGEYKKLYWATIVSGLLLVVLGYLQLILVPNFQFMAKLGWDPHVGRLLSTFFDPNFFGMFLVIISSLLLARLLIYPRFTLATLFLWVSWGVTVVALFLTFSRSSYLAFLMSLFLILFVRAWKWLMLGIMIIVLVGIAIPRVKTRVLGALQLDTTALDRVQSWKETLAIVQDHSIVGVGYNAFGPAQVRYGFRHNLLGHSSRGSDSSFLLVAATTGIIGFLLYGLFLLSLFLETLVVYRHTLSGTLKIISLAMLGILPSYVVHSQFVNSLFYPLVFIPFGFLVAGILYGVTQSKKETALENS